MTTQNWFSAPAPIAARVRAYFAPVNRSAATPTIFDPTQQASFNLDTPPAPWINLGWIRNFVRKSMSKSAPVLAGIPASPLESVRETLEAQVSLQFLNWTKLTMALASGSQHMNLLAPLSGAAQAADGAQAEPAVVPQAGSTASSIVLASADAAKFSAGSLIAVDADYAGQTGFVGAPVSGAYIRQPLTDVDYIRRVTFNVGFVTQVSTSGITLQQPLIGGVPTAGAKVQAITGFVDREGGSFYQEWSALFVMQGSLGERVFFYYPRLQPMQPSEETVTPLARNGTGTQKRILLDGRFLAFPVADPLDGERVVCYRSFTPAPNALI